MRCNWRRWLWGLIPLLLLSFIATEVEHARLESDLARRAALALSQAGLGWAAAEFNGRDGVLTGLAPQEGEPGKAAELLASVWGVRLIENRAGLIEKAERYLWWASRRNTRIRLSGYVPSSNARQAILGVTRAIFPGFEVVDRMASARGVPAIDDWLGGISFALKQLASLKRGDVRLEDLGLAVAGEAEDGAAYRAMKAVLRGGLPKGIKLIGEEVTPPVVAPYTWSAKFLNGELVLTGYVPSETDRAGLLDAAKTSAPSAQLSDQMEPGEGAPQGWAAAAIASLRELPRLQDASAELRDAVLTVSGTASDVSTAEAIRSRLHAALPTTIAFRDEISARPPPASETLPAADTARTAGEPPEATGVDKDDARPAAASPVGEATAGAAGAPPNEANAPAATPAPGASASAAGAPPTNEANASATGAPPAQGANASATAAAPANEANASATAAPSGKETSASAIAVPPEPPEPRVVSSGDPRSQGCADALSAAAKAGIILFRLGSAELEARSIPTLDRLAKAAQSCPGMLIEVGGHASADGGDAVNRRLSLRRAQSVVAYLVRAGVDRQQLASMGFGASRPLVPNDNSEHMARNRRIEFTVHPK
jgi:OmpA-OmpF porin, OOP family